MPMLTHKVNLPVLLCVLVVFLSCCLFVCCLFVLLFVCLLFVCLVCLFVLLFVCLVCLFDLLVCLVCLLVLFVCLSCCFVGLCVYLRGCACKSLPAVYLVCNAQSCTVKNGLLL